MTSSPSSDGKRFIGDLIEIPEAVHDGDLVFKVSDGVEQQAAQAVRDYVVTPQLAACFDEALGTIKGALAKGQSRATYLNGSFGSGKSHFMAVLHAVLRHDPAVRGVERMPTVLARHDDWLEGRKFLLVTSHLVDADSIESAILGGYARHVHRNHPEASVPAVYRTEGLLADARGMRAALGDEKFAEGLSAAADPGSGGSWGKWSAPAEWTTQRLDEAFAVSPASTDESELALRRALVSALLKSHFKRYADTVHGDAEAFVTLDDGLSAISRHAKEELGCDAVILLLDELVLRFTKFIGDESRINEEVQKVSKLVESSESHRPAPILSFVPRQRDLRDLVGLSGSTEGVGQTIKYWDGRFGHISLEDRNLTEVVRHRLLRPRSPEAATEIAAAFERMVNTRPEVRDTLLDTEGGDADTWDDFGALYPFSPALLHVMVDLSSALQRQRSALKLMRQLMVNHRATLPVGQLVPMGAVLDVLVEGEDRPFRDRLSAEYDKIRGFYRDRVRPWLLRRHGMSDGDTGGLEVRHPFRAEDLLVKTLLLSALVPNVPALKELTAGRLIALNHGIVPARRTGQDIARVAQFFRELNAQFGEVRVGAEKSNPTVALNLLRVDTESLMRSSYTAANDQALRRLFKRMLWEEMGLGPDAASTTTTWRGTRRLVELDFGNIRSEDSLMRQRFVPEAPGAVRVVIDYPFDDGDHNPAEDRQRVRDLREEFDTPPATLAWIPHFLSANRQQDARRLLMMEHLVQPGVIEEKAPNWSSEDQREARAQLDNQRSQIERQLRDLLRGAYGAANRNDTDFGHGIDEHIEALPPGVRIRVEAGSQLGAALHRVAGKLLDHLYPEHPRFASPSGATPEVRRADLTAVLQAVEEAKADKLQRYEPVKGELDALYRVAHNLGIAKVTEVFSLNRTWLAALDEAARTAKADTTEIRVRELKEWIRDQEQGKGLPPDIVDLLVLVYAVQSDRAFIRGGRRYTDVGIGRLEGDIVLRRQALPSEEDFDLANRRAEQVFRLARQPVLNVRAVQRLAEDLKERSGAWLAGTEALLAQLEKRAGLLGLDEESPRLRTARATHALLTRLRGIADDTELVVALARAGLPGEGAVYQAGLAAAGTVAAKLESTGWANLETLNDLANGGGDHAEAAARLLERLAKSARCDEQQQKLATELDAVSADAAVLIRKAVTRPQPPKPPVVRPDTGDGTPPGGTERAAGDGEAVATIGAADDPAKVIAELRERLGASPAATIEVTVRVVG
ncbi:phage resistance protein [Actinorugispora endophytica]|uniref:Phage resistance protein n=1 Tax=Actinorugispora endophytica TaxID=1605990 RepID=A0A4R6V1K4_9ACTN|nr:phage resistance protein [Actinorugispora endophytica]TDQ53763.1 hypothetical protein EV190_103214 [Actinorugispora endophytica]